ncbi:hypothetical protein K1T35_47695 (plasmid) [Pseudonocardia sp. DSM 110487]|uniref:hypothetical protein n=1 Tax=Pseudonocardia sp. DSM 110487 TaxID=2865833 RepID=UPI001C6965B5|nr:hypothetical protein [Pseudonocardia sp. DSM 110487]QYN41035.1 hypothetical protein K1T35_47695 [Pseudonocardia sp. DSM 110487]
MRTDRTPIAERFPRLGSFVEVRWVGGRAGDERVPGPSTYFIEAVVTLSPDDVARLASSFELTPAASPPRSPASLTSFLEGRGLEERGRWWTSTELEAGFGPSGWVSDVFIALDEGVAYVSARGE